MRRASRSRPRELVAALVLSLATGPLLLATGAGAATLPPGFVDEAVIADLESPACLAFAPDGRMFVGERIEGRLRVAHLDPEASTWALAAEPFHVFDVPKDGGGQPQAHRSSGLRDFAFDPSYGSQPYVYAFYMKNAPRQNRLVRVRASVLDPDVSMPGSETLLLEMPFAVSESSGSHNGGAVEIGVDGMVYVTTGDGWVGGDVVQSLATFTGKVLRVGRDGVIPTDNPFYGATAGDLRAIYALGLRNPFSMSRHPSTGALYINDANGPGKADVFLVEPGVNYGHQGSGIGADRDAWANAASAGGYLVTGGAWYPDDGPFPAQYRSRYFAALWGSNSDEPGDIALIEDGPSPIVSLFAADVSAVDGSNPLKPVVTRVGPDGHLYYLLTDYTTGAGEVRRIRLDTAIFADGFESGDAAYWFVPSPLD